MFSKDNKKVELKDAETIIGPSIRVKGNFHGEGDIVIEGKVEGSIKTNNFLLVGEKAKIVAEVEAGNAQIGGDITGNLQIKGYLEITSSAKIIGDIECSEISIEKGAIINGKCTMIKNQTNSHKSKLEEEEEK